MTSLANSAPTSPDDAPETPTHLVVGRSAAMQRLRQRIEALSALRVSVLVRGEPGTGRRHVARALHDSSSSESRGLTVIEANPENARPISPDRRRSYLLHEIDSAPRTDQSLWAELARRAEADEPEAPHRILATTAQDLSSLARSGEFDPDLEKALGRFVLELPPLRDRPEDISDLANNLAEKAARKIRGGSVRITSGASALLTAQPWPGNVKELADTVEKLVAFCPGDQVTRGQVRGILDETPKGVTSSRRLQTRKQRDELVALIEDTGGNLAEVARRLDMSRGGVIYRAQKFGLLPRRA